MKNILSTLLQSFLIFSYLILIGYVIFYDPICQNKYRNDALKNAINSHDLQDIFTGYQSYCKSLTVAFHFPKLMSVDQGGNIMEFDWILNVLLGGIDRPIKIVYGDDASALLKIPINDTLHVYLFEPPMKDMFRKFKEAGIQISTYTKNFKFLGIVNQGAFQMGDETMIYDVKYYKDADYVFRNYYNVKYEKQYPNLHFVPLGTKTGYGSMTGMFRSIKNEFINGDRQRAYPYREIWKTSRSMFSSNFEKMSISKCKPNKLAKFNFRNCITPLYGHIYC